MPRMYRNRAKKRSPEAKKRSVRGIDEQVSGWSWPGRTSAPPRREERESVSKPQSDRPQNNGGFRCPGVYIRERQTN